MFVLLFLPCNVAFALNTDYVSDEKMWYNCENIVCFERGDFQGVLKYEIDENDGCFYMFLFYDDKAVIERENVEIHFCIKNSLSTYRFAVDKNGFTESSDDDAKENIILCQSFNKSGKVLIGFELKNKADRKLDNYIFCEYSNGIGEIQTLLENAELKMYVPETIKNTTVKKTTTKKADDKNSLDNNTKKPVINKTEKSTTSSLAGKQESSTKFKGSGVVTKNADNVKNNISKFSAVPDNTESYSENIGSKTTVSAVNKEETQNFAVSIETEETTQFTSQVKVLIVICIVTAVIGLIFILFGVFSKKKTE